MIKAPSETKPETPKPEISKPKIPKPEAQKLEKPKLEIRVNKNKLKNLWKDFDELRHNFSKKEINRYRKAFYIAKNKKHLSKPEIKKTNRSFNRFKKSLIFKHFRGIDSVDYEDLDNHDYNYDFPDDDEYRKIGSIRTLFKELDRDYYKPIRTDAGFAGRNDKLYRMYE